MGLQIYERFVEEEEGAGGVERREWLAREKIERRFSRVENWDVKGMERKKEEGKWDSRKKWNKIKIFDQIIKKNHCFRVVQ